MKKEKKDDVKRVVGMLFHDNRGKTFTGIKIDSERYMKRIDKLERMDDIGFWIEILDDISEEYELSGEEKEKLLKQLDTNFQSFVDELINIRFEHTFEPSDEKEIKVEKYEALEEELKKNPHIIKENYVKIFFLEEETEELYTDPLMPNKIPTWPITQIEIDKDNLSLKISGGKRQRKRIINHIEKSVEENLFVETESLNFKKFDMSLKKFFDKVMSDSPFVIEEIKLSYPGIFFWIKTEFDINEFGDYLSIMDDPSDFLNIKKISLKYIKDKETEISVELIFDIQHKKTGDKIERSFSIKMSVPKRFRKDDVLNEIEKELKNIGIEPGTEYSLPASYYLKRVLLDKNYRDIYLKFLVETHSEDEVIKFLFDKNIMSYEEDKYCFGEDKFLKTVASGLRKIQDRIVELPRDSKEKARITNIKKIGDRIEMLIIISQDKEGFHYDTRYKTILTTKKRGYRKYEKIYFAVIEHINYYKLMENILKNKNEDNILYLHALLSKSLRHNLLILQRLANRTFENTKHLIENSDGMNKRTLGNQMEINMNILLRYLFGNYIAMGGKDRPDGYLYLSEDHQYIIDVKMHEKMTKEEYRKMKGYLDNFYSENHIEEPRIRKGILIIGEEIMRNDKLTLSAKRKVFLDTRQYEVGFVTLEFILDMFEIHVHHPHLEKYTAKFTDALKYCFIEYVEKSQTCETVGDLNTLRVEKISELKEKINVILPHYQPQRRKEAQ